MDPSSDPSYDPTSADLLSYLASLLRVSGSHLDAQLDWEYALPGSTPGDTYLLDLYIRLLPNPSLGPVTDDDRELLAHLLEVTCDPLSAAAPISLMAADFYRRYFDLPYSLDAQGQLFGSLARLSAPMVITNAFAVPSTGEFGNSVFGLFSEAHMATHHDLDRDVVTIRWAPPIMQLLSQATPSDIDDLCVQLTTPEDADDDELPF